MDAGSDRCNMCPEVRAIVLLFGDVNVFIVWVSGRLRVVMVIFLGDNKLQTLNLHQLFALKQSIHRLKRRIRSMIVHC